tara:strand:+ start:213 stop:395 length:183 start_codon:yes stop_codon:yes gene_type:complete
MSTSKPTVLESFKLAKQLLKEIKQHKKTNQLKEKTYHPSKWLIGNEIWYSPKKKGDKNDN